MLKNASGIFHATKEIYKHGSKKQANAGPNVMGKKRGKKKGTQTCYADIMLWCAFVFKSLLLVIMLSFPIIT